MGLYSFPPLKVAMGLLSLFPLIAKKNDSETLFYVKINWICDELFYRLSGNSNLLWKMLPHETVLITI